MAALSSLFDKNPARRRIELRPSTILRRLMEFQKFLMALSVLPGTSLAISAHLLPILLCSLRINCSSWVDQGSRFIAGSNWLCHRSRICFAERSGRLFAILHQRRRPNFCTISRIRSSSCCVHGSRLSRVRGFGQRDADCQRLA